MTTEIICIMCPLGCKIEVQIEGGETKKVLGNQCKKGVKYAQQEVSFPGRILATTLKTDGLEAPLVPVRSDKEIPKEKLIECMKEIARHTVCGPTAPGHIVIPDILGLGVNIVACRSIARGK